VAIIGGGLVGLATALQTLRRRPDGAVLLLEKEEALVQHQSGRNSGVLHAGLHYRPNSFRARLAVRGIREMITFCRENGVAHEVCGKLVVAADDAEVTRLHALYERGKRNGLAGLRVLNPAEARAIEPQVACLAALSVPEEGIVDYREVGVAMAREIHARGGQVHTRSRVRSAVRDGTTWILQTDRHEYRAGHVVNCAGLHADRVAELMGLEVPVRIVPFRGDYFRLKPESAGLVRNLIYPVPDTRFPFLGVHFTRMVRGGVECGPNAALVLDREGYEHRGPNWRDALDTLSFPGFWRFAARHAAAVTAEIKRSLSPRAFANALRRLVPAVTEWDLIPGGTGIRAQAMHRDGTLVEDFLLCSQPGAVHVLNAPSPAATASLAIGDQIAAQLSGDGAEVDKCA
jgi:L-2-hydroxyglutarate oxidase